MNYPFRKAGIITAVNTAITVINLRVYIKMREERHRGLNDISDLCRNCEENIQQAVRCKKAEDKSYIMSIKKLSLNYSPS